MYLNAAIISFEVSNSEDVEKYIYTFLNVLMWKREDVLEDKSNFGNLFVDKRIKHKVKFIDKLSLKRKYNAKFIFWVFSDSNENKLAEVCE